MDALARNDVTQKTKKSIQFIILKKNTRVKYYQRCEVRVKNNKICVTPNGENASSAINVNLATNIIKYEYAIYFRELDSIGFALIFSHKRYCNFVFNSLQQKQIDNGIKTTKISNELIEKLFLKPLIKELHIYSQLKFEFGVFILKLLKSLDNEQKKRLAPLIIATKIEKCLLDSVLKGVDLASSNEAGSSKMPMLLRQDTDSEVEFLYESNGNQRSKVCGNLPASSRDTFISNGTGTDGRGRDNPSSSGEIYNMEYNNDNLNLLKRRNNMNDFADKERNDESETLPPKKIGRKMKTHSSKSTAPELDEIIRAPNFEVISYIQNGISKSRLIIFPTSDRTQCFEYFFDFNRQIYVCCGCNNGKCTHAIICQNSEGIDYVKCLRTDHICKLRPYKPDKFKTDYIIKKPNFQLKGVFDELLLFTSADKKKFYKFTYDAHQKLYICMKCWTKKNYIQACVCYDENGEKYISVRNRKHICSKMNYLVSDDCETGETAALPNYQHVVRNLTKTPAKKKVAKKQKWKSR